MTANNDEIEPTGTRTGDLLWIAVNRRILALTHALAEVAGDESKRSEIEKLRDEYVEIQGRVGEIAKAAAAAQFIERTVWANYDGDITSPFVIKGFYGDDGVGYIKVEIPANDALVGTTLYDALNGYEA